MKPYVLDASAVLVYLEDRQGAKQVRGLFERAERAEASLSMSVVNWGEALYVISKTTGEQRAREVLIPLGKALDLCSADRVQAELAARLKYRYKIGYADSFGAALALTKRATLVSSDPDFGKLGRQIRILRLPRHIA